MFRKYRAMFETFAEGVFFHLCIVQMIAIVALSYWEV